MTKQQANKAAKLVAKLEQELAQAAAAQNWDMWDSIQEMLYNAKTYGQVTKPVYRETTAAEDYDSYMLSQY
jgi:hypothetical protein